MTSETKLEKLAADLQHWRTVEKVRPNQAFPPDMLSQALALSKDLGLGRVAIATGIQPQRLKVGLHLPTKQARTQKNRAYSKILAASGERLVIELGGGKQIACTVADAGAVLAEIIRRV